MKERNDRADERMMLDDGGRTLEEIISTVAEQELAEIPPAAMTPEKLAAMVAQRKAAREAEYEGTHEGDREIIDKAAREATRKAGKRRYLYKLGGGIVAVLVLILIGGAIAFNALSVDVGADKNQKEEIVTEDGVVIEDGGYGAEHDGGDVWSTDVWEDVSTAKELYPELMIPEYVPEGYEFSSLYVEYLNSENIIFKYIFNEARNNVPLEIEVFIQNTSEISLDMDSVLRTIESSKGKIYIQEFENKIATMQYDDGISVLIRGDISDAETIKIIEGTD